jgi:TrmH family RNA methyltransferase
MDTLDNIYFIIVEPRSPGNIGSLSRACKNMGISNIILINPVDYLVDETYKMGWAAEDVINSIIIAENLEDVIKDMHVTIGTTQRKRDNQIPLFTPKNITNKIAPLQSKHKIAFVFGRENNGLSNYELTLCDYLSTIPSKVSYPSLNLSQSVMLYAYELFNNISFKDKEIYKWDLANKAETEQLYNKLENVITSLSIETRHGDKAFTNLFRRVLGRTSLETRDVKLFIKLFNTINK